MLFSISHSRKKSRFESSVLLPQLHSHLSLGVPGSVSLVSALLFSKNDCPLSPVQTPHIPAICPPLNSSLSPRLAKTLPVSWLPSGFPKKPPKKKDLFLGTICQQLPTLYLGLYCFPQKSSSTSHKNH